MPSTPFNPNSGYSNLEPSSPRSPVAPRYGGGAQQPAGQQQMYSTGGMPSPTRGRYDDVRGPDSASGSALDERGPGAVASGAIGGGYGPYSYDGAGSHRPARDSSLSNSTSSLAGPSSNRYTPRHSSQPSPFAVANQPPSTSSSHSSHRLTTNPQAAAAAAAATPLTGATRSAPVFTARDAELDDKLHNPSPHDKDDHVSCTVFSLRGVLNMGMIIILVAALLTLFAGYPIIQWAQSQQAETYGAYGVGGINASGQVPDIPGLPTLIDKDTPSNKLTRTGYDGKKYVLVFSDEFETEGRTFWPGDDPFWEGVDIHYWATGDFEWYDPDALTTKDGNLVITLSEEPIHGLNFRSGMLQSWNKFCFTGGYIEVSIMLPGSGAIGGFWPGAWTMGNLGRAGHGATTDGVWPYSYDSCDIGTLPNQTNLAGTGPAATLNSGSKDYGGSLSYLPGQKLSSCTCASDADEHPGPNVGVGRGSPEIDIIEAQVSWTGKELVGSVSQSAQFAPYDDGYEYDNTTASCQVYDKAQTYLNDYKGGVYQQAVSGVTYTNPEAYADEGAVFSTYGWEANAGAAADGSDGYVTWMVDDKKAWNMDASAVAPNPRTQVSQRLVSREPMYIILNLGISDSFQSINWAELGFPAEMLVDYVRVYQREDEQNVGCDPPDMPTADYIQNHLKAYMNPNATTWDAAGYTKPKNSLQGC